MFSGEFELRKLIPKLSTLPTSAREADNIGFIEKNSYYINITIQFPPYLQHKHLYDLIPSKLM